MKRSRLIGYATLICLPALALLGIWLYMVIGELPSLVRAQQSRIGIEYRRQAEHLIANPQLAAAVPRRIKGWRRVSTIKGVPWGRYMADGRSFIWFEVSKKRYMQAEVPTLDEFPYELVVCWGGGLVVLTMWTLTAFAVWCFCRYVRERDDFLAATAHDLKTPLVAMRMMIGVNDDEARKLNERLIRLVGNITDFIRRGKRPKPAMEKIDLKAIYDEAYALFREDYRELWDGADIEVATADQATQAMGDVTMTTQIFWNILGNDLKYAAPYGKVRVGFSKAEGMVKVEIVDEGQGMTRSQMRKAFDRYYRAKTVAESGRGGFGIGLCTAREMARTMGGDLTVAANNPKGCIFTLSLLSAF